jgi:hypothetical protein
VRYAVFFFVVGLAGCSGVPSQDDAGVEPPDAAVEERDAGSLPGDAGAGDAGLDGGELEDAGFPDAGLEDAGLTDAGFTDAGFTDAGITDAGITDAGITDAGITVDAGSPIDAGSTIDAGFDAGVMDAGIRDAGVDAGIDAGPPNPCSISNGGCDALTQCTNLNGQATCGACPSGYTGTGATGCTDINECTTLADAGCTGTQVCANTPGAYLCAGRVTGTILYDALDAPPVGNTAASGQIQPCPEGTLSIGYVFGTNSMSRITQARALCSPLTLNGSASAGYTLSTTLPAVPPNDSRLCPANEVVTGMGVSYSTELRSMTVRCAPLSVQADSNGFRVVTGTEHDLVRYPSASSPASTNDVACPANSVGSGGTVYGGAYLFAFGLRCVKPSLKYDVPSISFGATTDSPVIGINNGTASNRDLCPAGQIVTGVEVADSFRSFAVECGTPVFDLPLRVAISPADTLAHRGLLAPQVAYPCFLGGALTRIELFTQGNFILGRMGLSCAGFTASTMPTWSLSVDPTSVAVPVSPYPGTPKSTTCPAGEVAVGVASSLYLQSNGYRTLSHIGLICAAPRVP